MRRITVTLAVVAFVANFSLVPCVQAEEQKNLADLSLEELLSIKVTSVSKRSQSVAQSAAAVFVITEDDIRRSGLTTIPELLRLAPGVNVAQIDVSTWAISIRGYNGVWANKLLVLIDGRSIYTSDFGNVDWGAVDTLIEDIDRIEIIRGPGATLWGSNAVNGIINIITRTASSDPGGLAIAGAGTQERAFGAVRYAGTGGDSLSYRVFMKHVNREGVVAKPTTLEQFDGDRKQDLFGGRLEWKWSSKDTLTLRSEGSAGRDNRAGSVLNLTPPFSVFLQRPVDRKSGFVMADWSRKRSEDSERLLRFYYDRKSNPRIDGANSISDTLSLEFQENALLRERHRIVWGLGFRDWINHTTERLQRSFVPANFDAQLLTGFIQDDFEIRANRLHVIAGVKVEHNTFSSSRIEAQPTLRTIWTPGRQHSIWASVSRALREPTREDQHIVVTLAAFPGAGGTVTTPMVFGVPTGEAESLIAYESGYRFQRSKKFSFDLAGFYGDYNGIVGHRRGVAYLDKEPVPHLVLPEYHQRVFDSQSYGGEAWSSLEITPRWKVSGSYSLVRVMARMRPGLGVLEAPHSNRTPEHQGFVQSSLRLGPISVDTTLFRVGAIRTVNVDAYNRLDARVGWLIRNRFEFSIAGQNLTAARHVEGWAGEGAFPVPLRRSVHAKLVWSF
jgi:iron complex outermembrane receptor protein